MRFVKHSRKYRLGARYMSSNDLFEGVLQLFKKRYCAQLILQG